MVGSFRCQFRFFDLALVESVRASRIESAASYFAERAFRAPFWEELDSTRNRLPERGLRRPATGCKGAESLKILNPKELFNDLSEGHHPDLIADVPYDRKVV